MSGAVLAASACAVLSVVGTLFAVSLFLNHDAAGYLTLADRLLDGLRLYEDTVTPNQLIVVYLHWVPAALARATPLSIVHAFYVFLFVLLNLCVWQSWRVLRDVPVLGAPAARTGSVVLLQFGLFVLPFARGNDFGQREQIFCALVAPYILLCARRLLGGPGLPNVDAVATGVLAAAGFCIKPHFLVLFAACELWLVWRGGRAETVRRPELFTIVAIGASYAVFWALAYPSVFALIPHFATAYVGFAKSAAEKLTAIAMPAGVAVLLVAAAALPSVRRTRAVRDVYGLGVVAVAATFAIYGLQSGFTYHVYLVLFFVVMLAGLAIVLSAGHRVALVIALLLSVLLAADFKAAAVRNAGDRDRVRKLTEWVEPQIAGKNVLVLSMGMFPWYSVIAGAGAKSTGSLWFLKYLPAAYAAEKGSSLAPTYHTPERMGEDERFYHEAIIRDFEVSPPEVVIVSTGIHHPAMPGTPFDILRYLQGDPRFEARWREYAPFFTTPEFAFFSRRAATREPMRRSVAGDRRR